MDEEARVNGTLIWYYNVCKREAWLMSHSITPDESDSNVEIGRFIHEKSYKREMKEVSTGNMKIDIFRKEHGQIVIGELKKSSKFKNIAIWQLKYYMYELEKEGVKATGELLFPEEKRKESVSLTDEDRINLNNQIREIIKLIYQSEPPEPIKIAFCKNCAYAEFCWA
ncbi:MAG: CRISPR-associated protein Cas4 [Thermoanaerobacteraceae bacterium]|nr:CRISPR-associated protein Cas4 [Thermoanaerobacteraceae bacterium]